MRPPWAKRTCRERPGAGCAAYRPLRKALVALRDDLLVARGLPSGVVRSATSFGGPLELAFDDRREDYRPDVQMRDRFTGKG